VLLGVNGQLVSGACLEQVLARKASASGGQGWPDHRLLQRWRAGCHSLGPASSARAILEAGADPLLRLLGFAPAIRADASREPLVVAFRGPSAMMTLLVVPWGARLDPLWREATTSARHHGSRWAVLFNGTHLRLLDAGGLFARRHLEFDLDLVADDEGSGAALWATLGAEAEVQSAAGPTLADLVAMSDTYGVSVCRALRDGVLSASADVLRALVGRRRRLDLASAFDQALTIVYRILFLLFAEARGLVPVWHPVYRESYSVDGLRAAAERGRATGLWDALRAVTRLAHAGCRTGDLNVTAFNGRLFDHARAPLAERRDLDDEAARRALLALTTRPSPQRAGRQRIAYGELGVDQLGAVYETLLDFVPRRVDATGPSKSRATASRVSIELCKGSEARKATGTFYTPQPFVRYLVREVLGPLVHDQPPARILSLSILDPAMGSGAFLVEACHFLAQAYEDALVACGGCTANDLGPEERATIRRRISERCLFGADLNPMAVQLARLSLWLTTLARERPLSFFDHHLRTGDSLIGTWVSSLRAAPRPRSRTADWLTPLLDGLDAGAAMQAVLPVRFSLTEASDTIEGVRRKERALAALEDADSPLARWKRVADLWCARWFGPGDAPPSSAFPALADAILTGHSQLPPATTTALLARSAHIAATRRFFHWELEFPEVFFGPDGQRLHAAGFDAVVGNPPWDMVRADFGDRHSRTHTRTETAGLLRFAREAGLYRARSAGHCNRYQLFMERALSLLKPGGRFGLVVPSGFASDQSSQALRRLVFSTSAVDGLVGFDNRQTAFPVHRSVRFLLMTGTYGRQTDRIGVRFGEVDPAVLESEAALSGPRDAWFPLQLTPALLERLSGEGLAIPNLRTRFDLVIAERASALFPPLGDPSGWHARFGRELNASDDRDLLQSPGIGRVPVIEGKQIEPFHVRRADARFGANARDLASRLGRRVDRPRLAYRDVASATNRVTLIAAILPGRCVSTHTVFCLKTALPPVAQHALCALFNSLIVNYLVRLRVTTHVTTAIVEGLPLPPLADHGAVLERLAQLARRLRRGFVRDAFAQLNATVARLYQLSRDELDYVLETFPLVEQADRDAVRRAFYGGP